MSKCEDKNGIHYCLTAIRWGPRNPRLLGRGNVDLVSGISVQVENIIVIGFVSRLIQHIEKKVPVLGQVCGTDTGSLLQFLLSLEVSHGMNIERFSLTRSFLRARRFLTLGRSE